MEELSYERDHFTQSVIPVWRKACQTDFATVETNKYVKVHVAVIAKGPKKVISRFVSHMALE